MSKNLVSTGWLALRLQSPDIVIIDSSWHLPATKRDAKCEFETKHIPGAQFYDLDAGAAMDTPLPHMLPPAEKFAAGMKALGVGGGKTVVCYDSTGLFSAARLWWMLKSFGHAHAYVLNGGLPKWEQEGGAVESGPATKAHTFDFTARLDKSRVANLQDVATALATGSAQLADARSATRFRGEEIEPRPNVRPGHMPGALNVHYAALLNADGTLKAGQALREAFESRGIDLAKPIITSCGSGVTAAILALGLSELGLENYKLYDGSWAEWGASDKPVATG
jgi:thiosulfate/3-mercaptopyruvate sulfurtransferase